MALPVTTRRTCGTDAVFMLSSLPDCFVGGKAPTHYIFPPKEIVYGQQRLSQVFSTICVHARAMLPHHTRLTRTVRPTTPGCACAPCVKAPSCLYPVKRKTSNSFLESASFAALADDSFRVAPVASVSRAPLLHYSANWAERGSSHRLVK